MVHAVSTGKVHAMLKSEWGLCGLEFGVLTMEKVHLLVVITSDINLKKHIFTLEKRSCHRDLVNGKLDLEINGVCWT